VTADTKTWWERIPSWLLWALAALAALALVLFVLWVGPWLFTRHPSSDLTDADALKAKNDVRTTLVQAVAGLAVASGAIVTYRTFRQNQLEQANRQDREERTYKLNQSQQVTDTYTKAVEQLGHEEAPVRLGAMYSLERLAQDNPPRRQTVVDVLCAYLRMPYTPPTRERAAPEPEADDATDARLASPVNDRRKRDAAQELQVRQTAQRLLADHLRTPLDIPHKDAQRLNASAEETFWPGISVDLTGATLVDLDLRGLSVVRAAFRRASFCGDARFDEATFSGDARFSGATFSGVALFAGATFSGVARFGGATFSGVARFGGATFSGVALFAGATFSGDAGFAGATFSGDAGFAGARFSGVAGFAGARFSGDVAFIAATFSGDVEFIMATFSGVAGFAGARFSGVAGFAGATFSGVARFGGATFSGDAWFIETTFSGDARFGGVRVLHLEQPDLNKGSESTRGVWPEGWTVRPDADDPSRGTLVSSAVGSH